MFVQAHDVALSGVLSCSSVPAGRALRAGFQRWRGSVVEVAQLEELQVVVLAAAGSSPVFHPNSIDLAGRRERRL